jgi:hypothetical protein
MKVAQEGELRVEFPDSAQIRKFDAEASHKLSHCMKAVDFVIELSNDILFLEFKDPEDADVPANQRAVYVSEFLSGKIDHDLKTKYRDSFLYEWASGRANKPIRYLVLIGASGVSDAELMVRTEMLKRLLPLSGPDGSAWSRPIVASCAVLNIASWNRSLHRFPATRA